MNSSPACGAFASPRALSDCVPLACLQRFAENYLHLFGELCDTSVLQVSLAVAINPAFARVAFKRVRRTGGVFCDLKSVSLCLA